MNLGHLALFLQRFALVNLVLALVLSLILAAQLETLAIPAAIFWSSLIWSAIVYLQAGTAESVLRLERQLATVRTELGQGFDSRRRLTEFANKLAELEIQNAELETQNAELALIAQAALDQRDAVHE